MGVQTFRPEDLDDEFHRAQETIPDNPSTASAYIVLGGTGFAYLMALTATLYVYINPPDQTYNPVQIEKALKLDR